MADQCHIKIIEEGVLTWNAWRHANLNEVPDLEEFDFSSKGSLDDPYDAYLHGIDLRHANLKGTNLSGALLTSARFENANLTRANLSGAVLRDASMTLSILEFADLRNADLVGCNLSKANLTQAILDGSVLCDASLHGSCLDEAILTNIDLSKTRGLHTTKFDQPPVIDERTLKRTQAGLVHFPFLRLDIEEFLTNIMKTPTVSGSFMSDPIYGEHGEKGKLGGQYTYF